MQTELKLSIKNIHWLNKEYLKPNLHTLGSVTDLRQRERERENNYSSILHTLLKYKCVNTYRTR